MSEATLEAPAAAPIPVDDAGEMKGSPFLEAFMTGQKPGEPEPAKPPAKPPEKETDKPAAEAKPPEAADPDDESKWVPPQEIKSDKGREGWKAVKLEAKTARQEAAALKARIAEYEQKLAERPGIPEDVQARMKELEAESAELSERLKVADVTSHPKFRQYFETRTNQYVEAAKSIVGSEHAAKVERILKITDTDLRSERLDDLMGELSPSRQAQLGAVITNLSMLEQERQSEISKAGERYKQIEQETKAQQEATVAQRRQHAEKLLAASAKLEAFDPGEKPDAPRMKEIEDYKTFVRAAATGTLSTEDAQFLPLAAVQGLHLKTKVVPALQSRIAELETQIKEYENAKPRGGNGMGSETQGEKSFMSVMGME